MPSKTLVIMAKFSQAQQSELNPQFYFLIYIDQTEVKSSKSLINLSTKQKNLLITFE
jgi:hypothetical protein